MIFPQTSTFYFYGTDPSPIFMYPQMIIPYTFQNPNVQLTGNIINQQTSFLENRLPVEEMKRKTKINPRSSIL